MWQLDCEQSWAPKNWCFWTVVLEKTLESPLDCKEIQPVHSKGDRSWVFYGRNDAKAGTPVLWPPHAKSWLIGKDSDAGGIGGRRRRGWQRMRWLDGITNSMVDREAWRACDSQGRRESVRHDWATELNWTDTYICICCSICTCEWCVSRCVCVCVCACVNMFISLDGASEKNNSWENKSTNVTYMSGGCFLPVLSGEG